MSRTYLIACLLASAALLAGGVWLSDVILQPIPMPLGGAAAFGWLGFWLLVRRRPLGGLGAGFIIGAVIGVIMHVRSHIVEDRVESIGSLTLHALGDLGISAMGAAVILAASIGWVPAVCRASTPGRA